MRKIPTYHFSDNFSDKLGRFTADFIAEGFKLFENEFAYIDSFVTSAKNDASERSDHQLRCSEKERYLLEMVSYKIYDQLNRDAFNKQKHTLIIMPDCLSIHEYECQKSEGDHGNLCKSCHSDCLGAEISDVAKHYGCRVLFSKRNLSEQLQHHAHELGNTAVIGVACIMMLSAGMRVAKDENIPARGVLLQYTGCEHWNDQPFASYFSIEQLKQILREKYGK